MPEVVSWRDGGHAVGTLRAKDGIVRVGFGEFTVKQRVFLSVGNSEIFAARRASCSVGICNGDFQSIFGVRVMGRCGLIGYIVWQAT